MYVSTLPFLLSLLCLILQNQTKQQYTLQPSMFWHTPEFSQDWRDHPHGPLTDTPSAFLVWLPLLCSRHPLHHASKLHPLVAIFGPFPAIYPQSHTWFTKFHQRQHMKQKVMKLPWRKHLILESQIQGTKHKVYSDSNRKKDSKSQGPTYWFNNATSYRSWYMLKTPLAWMRSYVRGYVEKASHLHT